MLDFLKDFPSVVNNGFSSFNKFAGNSLGDVTGQNRTFDYQKDLNALTMSREDTAYQRAVADAKAAGLSPLAVTSGASANSMSTARIDNTGALSFGTGLIDTISSANLKNAQASAIRKETEWNERHGFRNQDFQTALVGAIDGIVEKIVGLLPRSASEVVSDVASSAKDGASSAFDSFKAKSGEVVSAVKSAVSDAVSKADSSKSPKSPKSSEFSPIGFALSDSKSWTMGELKNIHDRFGVNIKLPSKKDYLAIVRKDGVGNANAWLTYFIHENNSHSKVNIHSAGAGRSW